MPVREFRKINRDGRQGDGARWGWAVLGRGDAEAESLPTVGIEADIIETKISAMHFFNVG